MDIPLFIYPYIYIIGGLSPLAHQNSPEAYWRYSIIDSVWIQFLSPSLSGHVSFTFKHWIVSCFGSLSNDCLWFDIMNLNQTMIGPVDEWPVARIHATMTRISSTKYILYGGENEKIMDDVWQLELSTSFRIHWTKLEASNQHARSGHVGVLLSDGTIYYHGGKASADENQSLYLNTSSGQWVHNRPIALRQLDVIQESNSKVIGRGAIAGIIVGVVATIVLGVGFLMWKRHRRQQDAESKSRAMRFSQSPSTNLSLQHIEKPLTPEIALPELAVTRTEQSAFSLTIDQLPAERDVRASRHRSLGNPIQERKDSSGRKRMTLNLFSNHEDRSPLFRNSRFIQSKTDPNLSRTSLGGRSVSSVQWVGFNDHMDYKQCRDSSASSIHLAVKNPVTANRSSYFTESSSSTPKSSLFPQNLRDSTVQYQENYSRQSMGS